MMYLVVPIEAIKNLSAAIFKTPKAPNFSLRRLDIHSFKIAISDKYVLHL